MSSGEHGIAVRRLGPDDTILGVEALRRLKAPDGYPVPSAAYVSTFLVRADNVLLVAVESETPVGYLVAYLLDRVDREQQMMFFYTGQRAQVDLSCAGRDEDVGSNRTLERSRDAPVREHGCGTLTGWR